MEADEVLGGDPAPVRTVAAPLPMHA